MQLPFEEIQRIVVTALQEDIGHGDVTSQAVFDHAAEATLQFVPREPLVLAGLDIAGFVFETVDASIDYMARRQDGESAEAGEVIASVMGPAASVLAAERVALNLLQRLCGIATQTARYVEAVKDTSCQILDTRKTMPGLRVLDKYAVRCGGGHNHRMRLDDAILIKDNHIAIVGSVGEAVRRAKASAPATMQVEVECDTLDQVREALEAGADMLLLDNMPLNRLKEAVILAKGKARTEASGNITLEQAGAVADTGVHFISVGSLTHSVRAADIGLDSAS